MDRLWVALVPALVALLVTGPNVVLRSDLILWVGVVVGLVVTTYGAVAAAVFYRELAAIAEYPAPAQSY